MAVTQATNLADFSSGINTDGNVINVGTALTLSHSDGIQFHTQHLHATGFDVNNINASGIITARSNIDVGTGTSIFSPASNVLTLGTNNEERLRIHSDGKLEVKGPSSGAGVIVLSSGDTTLTGDDVIGQINFKDYDANAHVGGDQDGYVNIKAIVKHETGNASDIDGSDGEGYDLTFSTSKRSGANASFTVSERLRIDSSGNAKFISNARQVIIQNGGTAGQPEIAFRNAADTGDAYGNIDGATLDLKTGGTSRLHITSNGQLQATGAADVRLTLGSGGTAGTNDSVHVRADGANLLFMNADTGITKFESNGTETLRITSAGAVNIGGDYTQTAYKTQITGDLLVQKSQAEYLHPQIELYATSDTAHGGAIKFSGKVSGAKYQQALIRTYGGSNNTDGSLAFHTGDGTEKLRLDANGNLNIGAKGYHSHSSSVDSLQIGYALNLYEDSYTSGNDNYLILANNARYDSGNKYMRNDEAMRIYMNAGKFAYQNAPAGTAGNNITFTDRLLITSGGYVGINRDPSEWLHVHAEENAGQTSASRTKSHGVLRLSLERNGGSPPYNGWGPSLDFWSDNYDGSTQRPNARITGSISNSSVDNSGGALRFFTTPTDTATTEDNYVERMAIDCNGLITTPAGPAFMAYRPQSTWTISASSIFPFNTVEYNRGGHFSTTTHRFTAPTTAVYQFNFSIIYYAANFTNAWVSLRKNGSRIQGGDLHFSIYFSSASRWHNVSYGMCLSLTLGDYVEMWNGGQSIDYHGNNWSNFSGFLVG